LALVVEDHDIVPLGLFLALARLLVAPAFRGRDAHVDDRIARIQPADFGIGPEISHQDDLVDAACHDTSPIGLRGEQAPNSRASYMIAPETTRPNAPRSGTVHMCFVLFLF
jgi:hypothetical protein